MHIRKLVLGALASNCYVVQLDAAQCVLVDIGEGAPVLLRVLAQSDLKPCAILLTHGHYDHIAGVEQVRQQYNAPVYIHALDAPMLTDSRANLGDALSDVPFRPVQQWQTVADGDTLSFGETAFTALHTPGHTPGSVCWQCGKALLTGDTLFHLSRGRTDFPGGSDAQMLDSFRKLKQLTGEYQVLPGHGEDSTLEYERTHNPTMRGI